MTNDPFAPPPDMTSRQVESATFLEDAMKGLASRPKTIPCKYFYDAQGSRLFEEITELEEYYLTRTELAIMERYVDEMVAYLGSRCLLVEYGSGSSRKTTILLEHMNEPAGYVPIDISAEQLSESAYRLGAAFPDIEIRPLAADYTESFELPSDLLEADRVVVYFPGSTIGNFEPPSARDFLARMAAVAGQGGGLLIGVDLDKDRAVLEAAYNDSRGVTDSFNKNLLRRMNVELGATFDLDAFRHEAVYNETEQRIEIYLISSRDQAVLLDGETIRFDEGEPILTEYSYKYTVEHFADLAASAGLAVRKVWTDEEELFSVQYLEAI